jgi:TPR repeat protein
MSAIRTFALAPAFFLLSAFSTLDDVKALIEDDKLEQGFRLAEERAAAGDWEGHQALAWFYDQGKVVAEDDSRAAVHFRKAAEAGSRHAQWRLGVMLDLGEGVPADPDEAFGWIAKAAAQGYREAFTSMGVMHALGRGTPVDYAKSRQWYLKAARAGEPHGFYGIAVLHEQGQGVERDLVEALAWLIVALTLGDEEAETAASKYDLGQADTRAAVERAKAILEEFGLSRHRIRFREFDSELQDADTV